ncbi:tripartite tricarboxylate transporter substrate binding protein [Salmonella enterica subsp. enterica serovar Enteritidis]|nr:tripartite tricarboxylate transporter substrate binding protein [Salmonella enterica subsp. enterica serovar Enteritidis]
MKPLRLLACAFAVVLAAPLAASAQADWPNQPIHVTVPFPAGGQADIVTRVVTERAAKILGQPILVEAKPGAGGNIGTGEVVKAAPDGYTWLSSGVPLTTAPSMYPESLGFDPLKDLAPVIRFGSTSFVLAVPTEVPASNVAEFVAYAKEHKGELSYAGSGIGSLVHLVSELFKIDADIDVQMIPYNGQPPAIADLLANRVQFMVLGVSLAKPLIAEGKLKALAIFDAERSPALPDVPTIVEAGYPGLVAAGWAGFNVPSGTPPEIIEKINKTVTEAIADPEVAAQITKAGWQAVPAQSPADFGKFLQEEVARWGKVVKAAGVKPN